MSDKFDQILGILNNAF